MRTVLQLYSRLAWAHFARLLPSSCALCGSNGNDVLCNDCARQFFGSRLAPNRESHPPRCRCCGLLLTTNWSEQCGDCLQAPPPFDATVVASSYGAPIDALVIALKFGHRLALAPLFARMLRDSLLDAESYGVPLPTLLIPVPLAPARLAQRGFNQALEIARPLSQLLGVPLEPQLALRIRDTRSQTTLHLRQRRNNVHQAFAINSEHTVALHGQHIGIVDDVMTTGSTLGELAGLLKRSGATRVTNLVFARTPVH